MRTITKELVKKMAEADMSTEQASYIIALEALEATQDTLKKAMAEMYDREFDGMRPWDKGLSDDAINEMLDMEEKMERYYNLYDREREYNKATDDLKDWALDKIRRHEIEGLPEDTRQIILSADAVEMARIESNLIKVALMM